MSPNAPFTNRYDIERLSHQTGIQNPFEHIEKKTVLGRALLLFSRYMTKKQQQHTKQPDFKKRQAGDI
ncbi:hypothetical protein [Pelistega ratti]|uniref:hypothetical protein n=1 Tax=Pelistega ratti TaxID=2652177 RepID=UPI0013597711|nr:hypothetical protein [Pelistega ratti]